MDPQDSPQKGGPQEKAPPVLIAPGVGPVEDSRAPDAPR